VALPPVPAPFVFNATVISWHDADTGRFYVDRGDRDYSVWTIRLVGCAARELSAPGGLEARDDLMRRLPPGVAVVLATVKPDKYGGRLLATVTYLRDGQPADLATDLIADGWAAPWDGSGKQPQPPWPRLSSTPSS
jgi:endonuclease YncB( thermonuclease family)